jgi:hypothetical protein
MLRLRWLNPCILETMLREICFPPKQHGPAENVIPRCSLEPGL